MALFDFLKDDKGMFQGGAEGRVGGRALDFLESEAINENVGSYREEATRDMAKNIDPSDSDSVSKMQQWMNYENKDKEGYEPLEVDGQFGPKTEAALRAVQGAVAPSQVGDAINKMGGDGSAYAENRATNAPAEPHYDRFGFGTESSQGPISHEEAGGFWGDMKDAAHYGPRNQSSGKNILEDLSNSLKGWNK